MRKIKFSSVMIKISKVSILCFFCIGYILSGNEDVLAQEKQKVAVIDLGEVIRSYDESEKLSNQLQQEIQKRQEEINKTKTDVEKYGLNLRGTLNTLGDKEREKKEGILKEKITNLREMEQKFNQELRTMQMNMQEQVSAKINEATKAIAQKKGYNLVLSKGVVIYISSQNDITDEVIKELNK